MQSKEDSRRYMIENVHVVSPLCGYEACSTVLVEDGLIRSIGDSPASFTGEVISGDGGTLGPGLIDMHIHGCAGHDGGDDDLATALQAMASFLQSQGITSFQLASFADLSLLTKLKKVLEENPILSDTLVGVYFEGPFINPVKKGGLKRESIKAFSAHYLEEILSYQLVRTMTIAPELADADILEATLRSKGVKVAYGHSMAKFKEIHHDHPVHLTHLYNAMVGLDHHGPGLALCPFLDKASTCELICDGVHVDEGLLAMTLKNLSRDQICIISDGMKAMGLGKGELLYDGKKAWCDGTACYDGNGTLIGSAVPIMETARSLCKKSLITIADLFTLASTNPARVLGLSDRGAIIPGKRADLVLLDENLQVRQVWKA